MRAALWLLALFAIAVAVALFAGNNQGTVTVFWPPYRIDLSLNLVLLLLVGFFFLLHVALRALAVLLSLPGEARRWRMQYQERALHAGLLDALSHLVAGRFIRSRKAVENLLRLERSLARGDDALPDADRLRALSHMLAGESAHVLQDRAARDEHIRQALTYATGRDAQELREGLLLRAARWAFDDHDAQAAQMWLNELPQGAARRTLALRLRFKVARLARQTLVALETARLLTKHRAFSEVTAGGIVRGLALELIQTAHDPVQLQKAWMQLDAAERLMPEVAIQAAERMLVLGGDPLLAQQWVLPVWEQMILPGSPVVNESCIRLVQVLERSFNQTAGAPDAVWLTRIETAQRSKPGDALLQYLAGMTCMRLNLWGKAQQLLKQALPQLHDEQLKRNTWRALALLAEQRDDPVAATAAWRNAAQG